MSERLVIGIDSSTQSVKAIAWTRNGRAIAEGRAPLEVLTPAPLAFEQDAESWWVALTTALRQLTTQIDAHQVDAIAIANQRETMVFLDGEGRPMAPATLWLDRRAKEMTALLSDEIGADRLHAISGKPVDVIACVYRMAYFRRTQPELMDHAARIGDVQSFLVERLTGRFETSWTAADPSGVFDIAAKQWSASLLDHFGLRQQQLPQAVRPGTAVGTLSAAAAEATGLGVGTPVHAGGGDGQCAALGAGAIAPGAIYLNLGTALVGGLWSPTAELSSYWRTLISPTGDGYLLETVQKAGTYLIDWLLTNFSAEGTSAAHFARLNAAIADIAIGSDGVTMCPYLIGCMDPHWNADARATITGLNSGHGIVHLYRAALEAMTLEFARALQQMRGRGVAVERIIAIGGGSENAAWLQMIADATGTPVLRCRTLQASSLGAGITAAVGAGWFDDFASAADAMVQYGGTIMPTPAAAAAWRELSDRQLSLYERNADLGP